MSFIIIQLVLLNTNMYESPLSSLDILFFIHLALVRISSTEFSTTSSIVVPSLRLEEDNGIPADELVQCSLFATKRRWLYFINLRGPKACIWSSSTLFTKRNMCIPDMEKKGASSGPSQNFPFCPEATPQDSHRAIPRAHLGNISTLPKHLE